MDAFLQIAFFKLLKLYPPGPLPARFVPLTPDVMPEMPFFLRLHWLLLLLAVTLTGCPALLEISTGEGAYGGGAFRYEDRVYPTNIRSASLYQFPVEESYPVLYLGQGQQLTLEFDELLPQEQRENDFFVDIISCTADWRPSGMVPVEFYEGFPNQRIADFQRSALHTKIPYVHYWYSFPRENEGFKRSGNYLLKVYRNNDPSDVVITRRFVVVEQKVNVQLLYEVGELVRQEMLNFSFRLQTQNLPTFNPVQDLQVVVLQNFNWRDALRLGSPRFQTDQELEYQVLINQDFPGGQEFRRHEVETTRMISQSVQDLEEREDIWEVYLYPDEPIGINNFGPQMDRNGSFIPRVMEFSEADYEADYLRNFFFLETSGPRPTGEDVYLYGELTDWQLLPEFRLDWSDTYRRYQTEVLLKQGIYDYQYVVADSNGLINPTPLEGLRRATENFYSVLVYYLRPGDRAARIVGFQAVNYRD